MPQTASISPVNISTNRKKNLNSRYAVNTYRSRNHRITNWSANISFSGSGLRFHLYVISTPPAKNNTKGSENVKAITVPFLVNITKKTQTEKKEHGKVKPAHFSGHQSVCQFYRINEWCAEQECPGCGKQEYM